MGASGTCVEARVRSMLCVSCVNTDSIRSNDDDDDDDANCGQYWSFACFTHTQRHVVRSMEARVQLIPAADAVAAHDLISTKSRIVGMAIDGNYCKFDSQKQYKCDYSIFSGDVSLNCIDLILLQWLCVRLPLQLVSMRATMLHLI